MATSTLIARKREDIANSALKTQRKNGNIPGILYAKNIKPLYIYAKDTALKPFVYTSEVNVINLQIDGAKDSYNCILKDIQFDPVSDKMIHFDLFGISETEKLTIEVPIQLVGIPIGVKDGGIIQHTVHKVEVECLPKDIPSHIEVNIEALMIGDAIHVSDLKPGNYVILDNANNTIVSVVPPVVEKVEEPVAVEGEVAAEPTEPEVIAKGKKDEEPEVEEKKKNN